MLQCQRVAACDSAASPSSGGFLHILNDVCDVYARQKGGGPAVKGGGCAGLRWLLPSCKFGTVRCRAMNHSPQCSPPAAFRNKATTTFSHNNNNSSSSECASATCFCQHCSCGTCLHFERKRSSSKSNFNSNCDSISRHRQRSLTRQGTEQPSRELSFSLFLSLSHSLNLSTVAKQLPQFT